MGLAIRVGWAILVVMILGAVLLDALAGIMDANSAMQVSQLWDQVQAVALVMIAVTLAGWWVMWRPHRE